MENGKVLDALPFPMINMGIQNDAFASDVASWNKTLGEPICKHEASMPVGDIRWSHCATCGAFHTFRINGHGLGMFIDVLHGSKWCIFPSIIHGPNTFAGITSFFEENFELDIEAATMYDLEAVMLIPGTRL
jgi:hypothetical protein